MNNYKNHQNDKNEIVKELKPTARVFARSLSRKLTKEEALKVSGGAKPDTRLSNGEDDYWV